MRGYGTYLIRSTRETSYTGKKTKQISSVLGWHPQIPSVPPVASVFSLLLLLTQSPSFCHVPVFSFSTSLRWKGHCGYQNSRRLEDEGAVAAVGMSGDQEAKAMLFIQQKYMTGYAQRRKKKLRSLPSGSP